MSDSFDVFKACREYWGDALKDKIKGRISLGLRFPLDNPEDGYEWIVLGCVGFCPGIHVPVTSDRVLSMVCIKMNGQRICCLRDHEN